MTRKLILVRHGRSLGNEDSSIYKEGTESAVCLNTEGVHQSLQCGKDLKGLWDQGYFNWWGHQYPQVYTSEMTRAKQTAGIVLDCMKLKYAPVYETPFLNERNYGKGNHTDEHHIDPFLSIPDGGESMAECRDRVSPWFDGIKSLLTEKDIIIFSHGELIKALVSHMLDLPYSDIFESQSTPNGVPYIYEMDGGLFVQSEYQFEVFRLNEKEY